MGSNLSQADFMRFKHISLLPFKKKRQWFQAQLAKLRVQTERHKIEVRRAFLVHDACARFNALAGRREAYRQRRRTFASIFRFSFAGEAGIDAGGLAREFFEQASAKIVDPNLGLFTFSRVGNTTYQISPSASLAVGGDAKAEDLFYFTGLLLGKALFDGHLVRAPLCRPLLKTLLGLPISLGDLEFVDEELYKNLCWVRDHTGVESAMLDFSVTTEVFGQPKVIKLLPGGEDIDVDDTNKSQYVRLRAKHRLVTAIKAHLEAFARGFFTVVPPKLAAVFDEQELELLMCGLPDIDVEDWKRHTRYAGGYHVMSGPVVWFWLCVRRMGSAQRARLLQFATGSSRVPSSGFAALQSRDGGIKQFTLKRIALRTSVFPVAHTCFNRIDLPEFCSFRELQKRLGEITHMDEENLRFNVE